MRLRVCTFLALLVFVPGIINSHQAPTASTQPSASAILAQSLAAMGGSAAVSDITLTGTAERIAGSDNETGTVTYRAVSNANRIDLNLSGGMRSEIRGLGTKGPGGNWIGPDGAVHEISEHNLQTDIGWFPIFTFGNLSAFPNAVLTYVGTETKEGVAVVHIQSSQVQSTLPVSIAALQQHLTQMDFYIDASTLLPVALAFNTHPDNNALLDIPVEFRFSDYRTVGSLTIPFHILEYFNGTLFMDVKIQQATPNSGLSSSSTIFSIQ